MKKNKKSIFIYFLEMLIVFILIDGVITVLPSVISNNITYYKSIQYFLSNIVKNIPYL